MKVGFLGVGNMGSRMAQSLLKNGIKVTACDPDPDATRALRQLGAAVASTPLELASIPGLRAVITMLPSPAAVREAYLGIHGLLTGAAHTLQPSLLIDSSTIDPMTSREIAEAASSTLLHPDSAQCYSALNPTMIDAPVSGGVPAAMNAALTFMVGGSNEAVDAAKPLLLKMGKRIVHCGPNGSGLAAKLANNLALSIQMAGVAEGLAFGQRLGLDPVLLTEIFNSSSAHSWSSEHYNPVPGVQDGVPSSRGYANGFSSALMVKDLSLTIEAAEKCQAVVPMAKKVKELYRQLPSHIDFSAIYEEVYHGKPAAAGGNA